jgi:sortase A
MKKIGLIIFLTLLAACGQDQVENVAEEPLETSVESTNETMDSESIETTNASETNTSKSGSYDKPIIKDGEYGVVPTRIEIPAIDVNASTETVGLLDNGQMGVPEDFMKVGWFKPGAMPGERGSSVLAGHVDNKTGPAVFFDLKDLSKGDEVIIHGKNDEKLVFEVTGKEVYPMNDAPVEDIFGYTSRRSMKLITCTGPFDRSRGGHIDRLVVYTELKSAS